MPRLLQKAIHFVDQQNWPGVQRDGLLSAESLLLRAGSDLEQGRVHRSASVILADGAMIRDQAPMPPSALQRCLDAPLEPADWYELLNRGIYFWVSGERAARHAHALRQRPQVRLTLEADRLADAYCDVAFVTPFNIGAALRKPAERGSRTLVRVNRWRGTAWVDEAAEGRPPRSPAHPPAELVIQTDIPDIFDFVISVDTLT